MNLFRLVIKSFRHYFPAHLAVAAGIALTTAIITGGLIVGDSVTHSLVEAARYRTGDITHLVRAGDRIFTAELAGGMENTDGFNATPAFQLGGTAVSEDGAKRLNRIQVWGLEEGFNDVAGRMPGLDSLGEAECIVSDNLALRLGLLPGDRFLLRIRIVSQVPDNAPFVSGSTQTVSARVRVRNLAGKDEMGRLNMQVSQTAPYNVFLPLDQVNRLMGLENNCNMLLVSAAGADTRELARSIAQNLNAADAGLDIEYIADRQEWKISSPRVFIDAASSAHIKSRLPQAEPVLTYFANSISAGERSTPYSFVSSLPEGLGENEITVNEWLAEDLGIKAGDSVLMKYFTIGPLRRLDETVRMFTVKEVVPIRGMFADPGLAPVIPGLSDAGSCSEWETGVPVDLEAIRDKDEDYWNRYRGTPKAFISLQTAEELWQNRFGLYTSFLAKAGAVEEPVGNTSTDGDILEFGRDLIEGLDPAQLGFEAVALEEEAMHAAENGIDFSQLFIGLSFFILVSGIILSLLLLNYNLLQRSSQTGTFKALGFPGKLTVRMILMENSLTALIGTLLGCVLAVVYTKLVFAGLNRVWYDIVRTSVLEVEIKPATLLIGMLISLITALLGIYFSTRWLLKKETADIQKGIRNKKSRLRLQWIIAVLLGLFSISLVTLRYIQTQVLGPATFFLAGGMLLIAILILSNAVLTKISLRKTILLDLSSLGRRTLSFGRGRSMTIIILLALGTYLVISTGANRKDFSSVSGQRSSGTGGFMFYAESTVPLLTDLNDPAKRMEQGLTEDFSLLQFRVSEGDDASCLNLNRISNPRIIACDPAGLDGRFTFQTRTEHLDGENPWGSLDKEIEGIVPAIADQTVIQWGLGKKPGDTLEYVNENGEVMKLLLVGGLAPSVFQGNVIISEKHFLENFPSSSGSNVFLVEGEAGAEDAIATDLSATFRDHGWEMAPTGQRLAEFNSVSNTYLSIFLIMGTFGLILGTIGLAIVLIRDIRARRHEIALLRASGFSSRKIRLYISEGYIILLITGVLSGFVTAIFSTLPVFVSSHSEVSLSFISFLAALILVNGLFWIWILTGSKLRGLKIVEDLRND